MDMETDEVVAPNEQENHNNEENGAVMEEEEVDQPEKLEDEAEKIEDKTESPQKKKITEIVFEEEEEEEEEEDRTEKIIQALDTVLSPHSTQENRIAAYNFLEEVKQSVKAMIKYGTELHKISYPESIRHFALQLLEDCIRLKWNKITVEQKVVIKDEAMKMLKSGTLPLLQESMHVKDQVTKLIVEMMKREWPQNWQCLLHDLTKIASSGPTQAEIVLLILLRTSEDVSTLKNFKLKTSRRQDMFRALNYSMKNIFKFFFNLLEEHYLLYSQSDEGSDAQTEHCRIVQMVLSTLTNFLEWANVDAIFAYNKPLFMAIVKLIYDKKLSLNVCECLYQLAQRKDRVQNRYYMMTLFNPEILSAIYSAAQTFSSEPVKESEYRILICLTQVIATLGIHLSNLWRDGYNVKEPEEFCVYLETLMAFSRHPSFAIYAETRTVWLHLFKNPFIVKTLSFKSVVPQWIQTVFSKCVKHGYPSSTDDLSSEYSRIDFDSDDEYQALYSAARSDSTECLKLAVQINPQVYFALLKYNLKNLLCENVQPKVLGIASSTLNKWEAFGLLSGYVILKILDVPEFEPPQTEGIEMLKAVCNYVAPDPAIQASILDTIWGLCCFLPKSPDVAEFVAGKILSCVIFKLPGETSRSLSKPVRILRRLSAALFIRLFKKYPKEFIPIYESLADKFDQIINSDECTNLEKVLLQQARITLAKNLADLEAQNEILGKVLSPIKDKWIESRNCFSSSVDLINYIGLNDDTENDENSEQAQNRKFISLSLGLIHAVIKYAEVTDVNAELSKKFLTLSKKVVMQHVFPLMQTTYSFCRAYNGLWAPEAYEHLNDFGKKTLDLSDTDIRSILGGQKTIDMRQPQLVQEPNKLEKLRNYLFSIHDTLCIIFGSVAHQCGSQFYEMPHLAEYTIRAPLYNISNLPDCRLRQLLRNFLRSFCEYCPSQYNESVLLPVMHHFCPAMVEIMKNKWEVLSKLDEEMSEQTSVLEDRVIIKEFLIRSTMREYVDMLKVMMTVSSKVDQNSDGGEKDSDMNDIEMSDNANLHDRKNRRQDYRNARDQNTDIPAVRISEFGQLVLNVDSICHPMVQSITMCLTGPDSMCIRKVLDPLQAIIKAMVKEYTQHLSEEAVGHLFTMLLKSLHMHGDDESTRGALLDCASRIYTLIRPNFKSVKEVLTTLPEVNKNDIEHLDRLTLEQRRMKLQRIAKIRKDALLRVIKPIIGVSIAEAFKNDIEIRDLPPMLLMDKSNKKSIRLDEATNGDMSLSALFND